MYNKNNYSNLLFRPLEFELKYQLLLGLVGSISSFITAQNLPIYVKIVIAAAFAIIALLIHRQMIKKLHNEPKVRKGYFFFVQVRFWSIVAIIIISMAFIIGLQFI